MGTALEKVAAVALATSFMFRTVSIATHVPAIFIFGDSIVDAGNNYYLATSLKPQFPNGVDLGSGTLFSGRLTNGRTVVDIIGEELGAKNFIPPALAPSSSGPVILHGLNYGSAAGAIFNEVLKDLGHTLHLDEQISYFEKTRQSVLSQIGVPAAAQLFEEAIFFISIGANDVKAWEDFSDNGTWATYDVYLHALISRFRSRLKMLYDLGARKVVVANCGVLGCIPHERDTHPTINGCTTFLSKQAKAYNKRLKTMLVNLTSTLKGSVFVNADSYAASEDILANHMSYGLKNVDTACCGLIGEYRSLNICGPFTPFCPNRSEYVFWDGYHLTESANLIVARQFLDGGSKYISPVNIRQLVNYKAPS